MKTAEKMRWVGQPLEMGDSLTRYLQEISYHELLTADEEVELAQAIEAGTAAEEQLAAVSVRGAEKVRRFGASSLLTLIEMVDADLGITFLPEMAQGSALLRNTRVKLWPMSESSYRKIGLAWRKGSRRVDEVQMLGDFLREHR